MGFENNNLVEKCNVLLPQISVQWHLTSECNNRCKHCYMGDVDSINKNNTELALDKLRLILEDLENFSLKRNIELKYIFSGGDPLLRNDFFEFLKDVKRYGRKFSILGNPETINLENLKSLCELGLEEFQISIDGLKETHDWVRGPGAFNRAIETVDLLHQVGLKSKVMFTLYPYNMDELIPLMSILAEVGVDIFSFDIGIPIGASKKIDCSNISSDQIRELFHKYLNEKDLLGKKGYSIKFREKNSLLLLAKMEKNKFSSCDNSHWECYGGCHVGWTSTCILENGVVVACRRMPIAIGDLLETSFENIWLGSKILRKFRRRESWEECGKCKLYSWCRGCPAVTYADTNDPFKKNTTCWNSGNIGENQISEVYNSNWPLTCSNDEEFNKLSNHINYDFSVNDVINSYEFRKYYTRFLINFKEKSNFLSNPGHYLNDLDKMTSQIIHWILTTMERF